MPGADEALHFWTLRFENDVKTYGTQTISAWYRVSIMVWEWCKNVWYSNKQNQNQKDTIVWEWCKNVWYSNASCRRCRVLLVWEWCKNVWYSNFGATSAISAWFENDVKTYGTQTQMGQGSSDRKFENDVKTYGTQTITWRSRPPRAFENDVKTYGTQTVTGDKEDTLLSLRMM